ncbi:hypothetical protein PLESTB_000956400 [Pleodorina starrii]|uniref:Uncharacterized protein n=1 Tax=Pleodorina starrii TaxID=330485 RepID=A0A9W6C3F4_9CHLO|nr:hypothetical protein PLESTB_000956400 [Pleodorina starrii]
MEGPRSTFFRISSSLAVHNAATPRSQSSTTTSSPSFVEHQTGVKAYQDSPAYLNNAHQNNPLFEGFPILRCGARMSESSELAIWGGNAQTPGRPGGSPKTPEQLRHLLTVLQYSMELHSAAEGPPNGTVPQLADELEPVAKKLKENELETPIEYQLLAEVQLALQGAGAIKRKLRATATPGSPAAGSGSGWHDNGATAPCQGVASPTGGHSGTGEAQPANTTGGVGARYSVSKQLLQSPSSSLSPLSWNGPATATCTPSFVVHDGCLSSPKELPTEHHRGQPRSTAVLSSSNVPILKISSHASLRPQDEGAASLNFQPQLYNWMKAMLSGSHAQSPPATAAGESLAAAVHTALSNTRTPPLVYGSPLHRRIQRLLAEQRTPSPFWHTAAQAGGAWVHGNGVKETPVGCRSAIYGSASLGSTPALDQDVDTHSPVASNRFTDTSSSRQTPASPRQGCNGVPMFLCSSMSPFWPTLREKYGRATGAPATGSMSNMAALATASACKVKDLAAALPSETGEDEAADLLAELGLDLQLDPPMACIISNLEVLEHVERWARDQFIAAKRVLQAAKGTIEEGSHDSNSPVSSGCTDLGAHPLVGIAIQTEPVGTRVGEQLSPCSASASAGAHCAAATGAHLAAWKVNSKGMVSAGSPLVQAVTEWDGGPNDASDVGKCSPMYRDQSMPSKNEEGVAASVRFFSNKGARNAMGFTECARQHRAISQFGTTQARRGLFHATHSSNGMVDGRRLDPAGGLSSTSPVLEAMPGRARPSPCTDGMLGSPQESPAACLSTGGVSATLAGRQQSLYPSTGENPEGVALSPALASTYRLGVTTPRCGVADPALAAGAPHPLTGAPLEAMSKGDFAPELLIASGSISGGSKAATGSDSPPREIARGRSEAEVLFIPGNTRPCRKTASGRCTAIPFWHASAPRFDDGEMEDAGASTQTVSSISSVSITTSESDYVANGVEGRWPVARVELQATDMASASEGNPTKFSLARHLRSFLASLVTCSHCGKAS